MLKSNELSGSPCQSPFVYVKKLVLKLFIFTAHLVFLYMFLRYGGIVVISQREEALDRLMNVKEYLNSFPSQSSEISNKHYQLIGNIALRTSKNDVKL